MGAASSYGLTTLESASSPVEGGRWFPYAVESIEALEARLIKDLRAEIKDKEFWEKVDLAFSLVEIPLLVLSIVYPAARVLKVIDWTMTTLGGVVSLYKLEVAQWTSGQVLKLMATQMFKEWIPMSAPENLFKERVEVGSGAIIDYTVERVALPQAKSGQELSATQKGLLAIYRIRCATDPTFLPRLAQMEKRLGEMLQKLKMTAAPTGQITPSPAQSSIPLNWGPSGTPWWRRQ